MRLIDADALIEFIDCGHLRNPLEMCFSERDVIDMIESRPSAQPEQKKGAWIPHDCLGRPSIDKDVCSCCGQRFYQIAETGCEWNFCPNCGAKMEVEE